MNPDNQLFSVREAAKLIGCSVSTLQRDISSGVLVPYELAPRRNPRGSRLDFSDLVLSRCFRVLASAGVLLCNLDVSSEVLGEALLPKIDQLPPRIRERASLLTSPAAEKRMMQVFLQVVDYEAVIVGRPYMPGESSAQPQWVVLPIWNEVLTAILHTHLHMKDLALKPIIMVSAEACAELLREMIAKSR